jgi:hypothetical protein
MEQIRLSKPMERALRMAAGSPATVHEWCTTPRTMNSLISRRLCDVTGALTPRGEWILGYLLTGGPNRSWQGDEIDRHVRIAQLVFHPDRNQLNEEWS